MNRRDFLTTATASTVAHTLAGCNESNRQAIDYSKHPQKSSDEAKRVNVNRNKKTVIKIINIFFIF